MSPTRESQEPTQRSDGTKIACIGLISAVIVAIIGLIGVLGAPIIAEFAKSLFAPTTTPTPTKTPATVLSPTITDTPTLTPVPSPTPTPTPTPYYVEIVVDASERMNAEFEGGTTKMESAWQTAGTIARIRAQQKQFVTVRLFGGGDPEGGSCHISHSLFDFTSDGQQIMNYLAESPTPAGEAAVVRALLDAAQELNAHENIGREIILLTGGDDGCNVALSAFYNSANQSLWTQTFVVLFSDEDLGPFTTLETQGANIYYDLVRNRDEAEAVAEEVANSPPPTPVLIAMVTPPTSPPPTPTTGGGPQPVSTPEPPPPPPTGGAATATRTPTPVIIQSPTHINTPTYTPTPTKTAVPPTSTPMPTHTPTATPTPTPVPLPFEDPSFEGSGIRTPPWWHWGWPDDGGTRDPDATDCVHSGNEALKVTRGTPAPNSAGDVFMQEIPFNAGQRLRFNAWLRILELSGGWAYVELIFALSDDVDLETYTGNTHSSEMGWTQIGVEGTAPEGTTMAKLKLVVMYELGGSGAVCFDDISASVQQQ